MKFLFKIVSLIFPLVAYIALFSSHLRIQTFFGHKCEINSIVFWDDVIFGKRIYDFMNEIEHWSLDILSACMYLLHYVLPFLYLFYLCSLNELTNVTKFILAFGVVNLFCVSVQYVMPTPPPWMLLPDFDLRPEAKFSRVDSMFHITLFKSIYSNSPLVCGAWPSLHTAWPSIILSLRPWVSKHVASLHVLLIGFSAIYSGHHYLIDVLFGFLFAVVLTRLCGYVVDKYFDIDAGNNFTEFFSNSFVLELSLRLGLTRKNDKMISSLLQDTFKLNQDVELV